MDRKELDARLVEAIHKQTLASEVRKLLSDSTLQSPECKHVLERAQTTLDKIRETCLRVGRNMVDQLKEAGIQSRFDSSGIGDRQNHQILIEIESKNPTRALLVAEKNGYQSFGSPKLLHSQDIGRISLFNVDDDSNRMEFRWPLGKSSFFLPIRTSNGGPLLFPIPISFRPVVSTYVSMRAILRKLGLRKASSSIGGYLGTPAELIPLLLKFADVIKNDILVDIGCGDGRVLIEAAKHIGCRGIGYEKDLRLCSIAIERSGQAGVDDLVSINHADATGIELENATVVFLFLPPRFTSDLLPGLVRQLPTNGRIVAHETLPISASIEADSVKPLLAETAMTVAHLWRSSEKKDERAQN